MNSKGITAILHNYGELLSFNVNCERYYAYILRKRVAATRLTHSQRLAWVEAKWSQNTAHWDFSVLWSWNIITLSFARIQSFMHSDNWIAINRQFIILLLYWKPIWLTQWLICTNSRSCDVEGGGPLLSNHEVSRERPENRPLGRTADSPSYWTGTLNPALALVQK